MAEIRMAVPADRAAIEALVAAAYSPYIPRMGRPPGPMRDDYAARIDRQEARVLVEDGGIVGVLVLVPEGEVMLLDNIAVDPASQGRGYGRQLMAFAEVAARAAGCRSLRLYTHETMVENIARYARLGFAETRRAVEDAYSRVHMAKDLSRDDGDQLTPPP